MDLGLGTSVANGEEVLPSLGPCSDTDDRQPGGSIPNMAFFLALAGLIVNFISKAGKDVKDLLYRVHLCLPASICPSVCKFGPKRGGEYQNPLKRPITQSRFLHIFLIGM